MTGPSLLPLLQRWADAGWLRRLDAAFARFVLELCPDASAPVVLAAALLAHLEGRGHACLDLDAWLADPDGLLGWPPPARAELRAWLAGMPAGPAAWHDTLRASPLVAVDDGSAAANRETGAAAALDVPPLVLRGSRLYLRRYWRYERIVAGELQRRAASPLAVDAGAARRWLDRLFGPAGDDADDAVDWQRVACGLALRGAVTIVTGGPGTGKTHTAARLLALLLAVDPAPEALRVALAAPTGKAAARLRQSVDAALAALQPAVGDELPLQDLAGRIGAARTLHALLGARPDTRRLRHDAARPLEVDLLIVDEASMIHLEMMAALLQALPPQARLVLLGDKDQLASVEAGAVLGDLCHAAEQGRYTAATARWVHDATGQDLPAALLSGGPPLAQQTAVLRHSHRYGGAIGELARAVNRGDAAAAAALLHGAADAALHVLQAQTPAAVVRLAIEGRAGATGGYGDYLDLLRQRPPAGDAAAFEAWVLGVIDAFDRFRLLCAVREGEWGAVGLNAAVEAALAAAGRIGGDATGVEGRPLMVTRNDAALGIFNGDIGITLRPDAPDQPLRVWFRGGDGLRSVAASRLADAETAYALTVHKSQGSEFGHSVLVLPREPARVLTRELVYTAVTRARRAFTLVSGRPAALADALAQRTRRASGLLERLEGAAAGNAAGNQAAE